MTKDNEFEFETADLPTTGTLYTLPEAVAEIARLDALGIIAVAEFFGRPELYPDGVPDQFSIRVTEITDRWRS